MELANQVHELGRAPQLGQNHPKGLSVDRVEGFRQVYQDGNEVHILFDALLLHLAYSDHVSGAAVWTESTLGFREVALVLAAVSRTAPVLEQGEECGIPEFCGHILFFSDAGEE